MNLKHKYIFTTLRILLGLYLIFAGVAGFLGAKMIVSGTPMEGITEKDIEATTIYWETGIIQLAKLVELIVGLMFLFNFRIALATVMLAPLSIGIVVYLAMLAPANLIHGIILLLVNIYFTHISWDKYLPILGCEKTTKKKTK